MILQRIVLPGFNDPTEIYELVLKDGELQKLGPTLLREATIRELAKYLTDLPRGPHVPIFVEPGFPQQALKLYE